ncbi:MAG: carboxymuconolactone decarboxylase family protein [Parasphingorhabdus sp.]|uniref:carboxymuconolactone decarboxylase family protein n=1 Tax=Parasphingorhabdus sp. TaxID=2709688 RepID=UPI0032988969
MSRIPTPAKVSEAPEGSHPLLEAVEGSIGSVPNLFRLVATSPATLEGMLGLNGALGKGALNAATRERIALAIANFNGCSYCNSAHTYIAKNVAKLDEAEIEANRKGRSTDAKADPAVQFALKIAEQRGRITDGDIAAVKLAGFTDAELLEIVGHVGYNILTNYLNEVFGTEIDFPVVEAARAA